MLEIIATDSFARLHAIRGQEEGVHHDLASAEAAIGACADEPGLAYTSHGTFQLLDGFHATPMADGTWSYAWVYAGAGRWSSDPGSDVVQVHYPWPREPWAALAGVPARPTGIWPLDDLDPFVAQPPSPPLARQHHLTLSWGTPSPPPGPPTAPDCSHDGAGRHGTTQDGVLLVIATGGWWKGIALLPRFTCAWEDLSTGQGGIGELAGPVVFFYSNAPEM